MSDTTTLDRQTLATTIDTHPEAWADGGRLAEPPFEGAGHDGITARSQVVFEHVPGHSFRRTTGIDAHHGSCASPASSATCPSATPDSRPVRSCPPRRRRRVG